MERNNFKKQNYANFYYYDKKNLKYISPQMITKSQQTVLKYARALYKQTYFSPGASTKRNTVQTTLGELQRVEEQFYVNCVNSAVKSVMQEKLSAVNALQLRFEPYAFLFLIKDSKLLNRYEYVFGSYMLVLYLTSLVMLEEHQNEINTQILKTQVNQFLQNLQHSLKQQETQEQQQLDFNKAMKQFIQSKKYIQSQLKEKTVGERPSEDIIKFYRQRVQNMSNLLMRQLKQRDQKRSSLAIERQMSQEDIARQTVKRKLLRTNNMRAESEKSGLSLQQVVTFIVVNLQQGKQISLPIAIQQDVNWQTRRELIQRKAAALQRSDTRIDSIPFTAKKTNLSVYDYVMSVGGTGKLRSVERSYPNRAMINYENGKIQALSIPYQTQRGTAFQGAIWKKLDFNWEKNGLIIDGSIESSRYRTTQSATVIVSTLKQFQGKQKEDLVDLVQRMSKSKNVMFSRQLPSVIRLTSKRLVKYYQKIQSFWLRILFSQNPDIEQFEKFLSGKRTIVNSTLVEILQVSQRYQNKILPEQIQVCSNGKIRRVLNIGPLKNESEYKLNMMMCALRRDILQRIKGNITEKFINEKSVQEIRTLTQVLILNTSTTSKMSRMSYSEVQLSNGLNVQPMEFNNWVVELNCELPSVQMINMDLQKRGLNKLQSIVKESNINMRNYGSSAQQVQRLMDDVAIGLLSSKGVTNKKVHHVMRNSIKGIMQMQMGENNNEYSTLGKWQTDGRKAGSGIILSSHPSIQRFFSSNTVNQFRLDLFVWHILFPQMELNEVQGMQLQDKLQQMQDLVEGNVQSKEFQENIKVDSTFEERKSVYQKFKDQTEKRQDTLRDKKGVAIKQLLKQQLRYSGETLMAYNQCTSFIRQGYRGDKKFFVPTSVITVDRQHSNECYPIIGVPKVQVTQEQKTVNTTYVTENFMMVDENTYTTLQAQGLIRSQEDKDDGGQKQLARLQQALEQTEASMLALAGKKCVAKTMRQKMIKNFSPVEVDPRHLQLAVQLQQQQIRIKDRITQIAEKLSLQEDGFVVLGQMNDKPKRTYLDTIYGKILVCMDKKVSRQVYMSLDWTGYLDITLVRGKSNSMFVYNIDNATSLSKSMRRPGRSAVAIKCGQAVSPPVQYFSRVVYQNTEQGEKLFAGFDLQFYGSMKGRCTAMKQQIASCSLFCPSKTRIQQQIWRTGSGEYFVLNGMLYLIGFSKRSEQFQPSEQQQRVLLRFSPLYKKVFATQRNYSLRMQNATHIDLGKTPQGGSICMLRQGTNFSVTIEREKFYQMGNTPSTPIHIFSQIVMGRSQTDFQLTLVKNGFLMLVDKVVQPLQEEQKGEVEMYVNLTQRQLKRLLFRRVEEQTQVENMQKYVYFPFAERQESGNFVQKVGRILRTQVQQQVVGKIRTLSKSGVFQQNAVEQIKKLRYAKPDKISWMNAQLTCKDTTEWLHQFVAHRLVQGIRSHFGDDVLSASVSVANPKGMSNSDNPRDVRVEMSLSPEAMALLGERFYIIDDDEKMMKVKDSGFRVSAYSDFRQIDMEEKQQILCENERTIKHMKKKMKNPRMLIFIQVKSRASIADLQQSQDKRGYVSNQNQIIFALARSGLYVSECQKFFSQLQTDLNCVKDLAFYMRNVNAHMNMTKGGYEMTKVLEGKSQTISMTVSSFLDRRRRVVKQ